MRNPNNEKEIGTSLYMVEYFVTFKQTYFHISYKKNRGKNQRSIF